MSFDSQIEEHIRRVVIEQMAAIAAQLGEEAGVSERKLRLEFRSEMIKLKSGLESEIDAKLSVLRKQMLSASEARVGIFEMGF